MNMTVTVQFMELSLQAFFFFFSCIAGDVHTRVQVQGVCFWELLCHLFIHCVPAAGVGPSLVPRPHKRGTSHEGQPGQENKALVPFCAQAHWRYELFMFNWCCYHTLPIYINNILLLSLIKWVLYLHAFQGIYIYCIPFQKSIPLCFLWQMLSWVYKKLLKMNINKIFICRNLKYINGTLY